jgi:hypothetical protein
VSGTHRCVCNLLFQYKYQISLQNNKDHLLSHIYSFIHIYKVYSKTISLHTTLSYPKWIPIKCYIFYPSFPSPRIPHINIQNQSKWSTICATIENTKFNNQIQALFNQQIYFSLQIDRCQLNQLLLFFYLILLSLTIISNQKYHG